MLLLSQCPVEYVSIIVLLVVCPHLHMLLQWLINRASVPKLIKPWWNYGGVAWTALFNPNAIVTCNALKTALRIRYYASRPTSACFYQIRRSDPLAVGWLSPRFVWGQSRRVLHVDPA